jgi:hypothetical protein
LEKKYDKNSLIKNFLEKFISLNEEKIKNIKKEILVLKEKNTKYHTSVLEKENVKINHPDYIKYLVDKGFELYELNDKFEYKKD